MELIHVQLTQVEDTHPRVDGLVQEQVLLVLLDGGQVLVVDDVPVVQGRCQLALDRSVVLGRVLAPGAVRGHKADVDSVPQVLHRLPEARVTHQLEEVLLEIVLGLLALLRVEVDVAFHPPALLEGDDRVNLLDDETVVPVELQIPDIHHVALA